MPGVFFFALLKLLTKTLQAVAPPPLSGICNSALKTFEFVIQFFFYIDCIPCMKILPGAGINTVPLLKCSAQRRSVCRHKTPA